MLAALRCQFGFNGLILGYGCDLRDDGHILGGSNLVGAYSSDEQASRTATYEYERIRQLAEGLN